MSYPYEQTNPILADGPAIAVVPTRFVRGKYGIANNTPPYSSMFDDMQARIDLVAEKNRLRRDALFLVRNQAGKHHPVNGEGGRFSLPNKQRLSLLGAELGGHPSEWNIPEAFQGALFAVSI